MGLFNHNWTSSASAGADPAAVAANTAAILANDTDIAAAVAERIANDADIATNATDIATNVIAINKRVQFVDSKTISVPADAPNIQAALDLAGEFYSKDGQITISLADGNYDLSQPLVSRHANKIIIRAAHHVAPLKHGGLSGVKATDKALVLAHQKVTISAALGNTSLLDSTAMLNNVEFASISFILRDTDNYVVFATYGVRLTFTNCTFFGGIYGISLYHRCFVYFNACTFLHQSSRHMYIWGGSVTHLNTCELLYASSVSVHAALNSTLYAKKCVIRSSDTGMYAQHGSSIYIYGGDYRCTSQPFYAWMGCFVSVNMSAALPLTINAPAMAQIYRSTLVVSGSDPAWFIPTISGAYLVRGLEGSHIRLAATMNSAPAAKIARLDQSSTGTSGGYTGTLSPAAGVEGNNRSKWD